MEATKPAAALLLAATALTGCGGDGDSEAAAFCAAIQRSEEANPFGVTASGNREPDLERYLAGLAEMSAAYKDAVAVAPSEIEEEFATYAEWATERYDAALAIEEPTGQMVDVVIFQGPEVDLPSAQLITYIDTECDIDFSD